MTTICVFWVWIITNIAHKLIKGINLAHAFHYIDGRMNCNSVNTWTAFSHFYSWQVRRVKFILILYFIDVKDDDGDSTQCQKVTESWAGRLITCPRWEPVWVWDCRRSLLSCGLKCSGVCNRLIGRCKVVYAKCSNDGRSDRLGTDAFPGVRGNVYESLLMFLDKKCRWRRSTL